MTSLGTGRLFWKIFFVLALVQSLGVLSVGVLFSLHFRETRQEQADAQRDGRMPPAPCRPAPGDRAPPPQSAHDAPDKPPAPDCWPQDERRRPPPPLLPLLPLLTTLAFSLVCAALLAWYFAKPIRNLKSAFDAMAQGNLKVRLGKLMGRRRDELADLGHDFDRMALRLQSLVDGQRRLFHDVSHEMRSPLARMQAAIGLARQQPQRAAETMDRIERESVRMDGLVRELLTLARLESGMSDGPRETVLLNELLSNLVDDARIEAETRGCSLHFSEQGEPRIEADSELLHRAFENILRNAIKHSPEQGEIRIDVDAIAADKVQVRISDQGSGVPESALASIFQPFYRANTAVRGDGHGLGLAIAQHVVNLHGGSIVAENLPGGGFCMRIVLPVLKD
ncbi:HAMP domain-containing sensor histidine kinase [Uliginosibacterium sediminicola]|uniref:histidine kinase n=1 Tax=Uliginosibacterium sediminicola TaxID=2024550 RepID=A0ABU9YYK9_9RHOO